MNKFTDWLINENNGKNKGNIFAPPLRSDEAIKFLCDYLLGEDWLSPNPVNSEQINTEIVDSILFKYSKKYRKEVRQARKNMSKNRISGKY